MLTSAQILINAQTFATRWQHESDEKSESQTFWNEFFAIFGLDRKTIAILEKRLKAEKSTKFADVFVPKKLLCEQKTKGKNLDDAAAQAREYLEQIRVQEPENLPPFFIVCDFATMRFYETIGTACVEFPLEKLPENIGLFNFLLDLETEIHHAQSLVNLQASAMMRELYNGIKADYDTDTVRKFLIRILFCLFAEDTGIFRPDQFNRLIDKHTKADGSDTGAMLTELFQTLNTAKRSPKLPEYLQEFDYINGGLFAETLPTIYFDSEMRQKLIHIGREINWGYISPEIFGSLFQEALDVNERRELGAHYTEKDNIEKVINSLFLDDLKAELAQISSLKRDKKKRLIEFQQKIAKLKFLDPACGTGNFLVAAYRALRELEIQVIHEYQKLDKTHLQSAVSIEQFFGIEIDGLAAEIAVLSMWLIDHLCNLHEGAALGKGYGSLNIPLRKSAHITHGNSLRLDWENVDFILGNPPFIGSTYQTKEQKADTQAVSGSLKNAGILDYVANWYVKAAQIMRDNPQVQAAFVSTNSICQGQQVEALWGALLDWGVEIHFAHRTFQWTSQAHGKAAVHCVIVGFRQPEKHSGAKYLFDYPDIKGQPEKREVANINPYLIDAPNVIIEKCSKPISGEPEMIYGSKPTDSGNLILSTEEKNELIAAEPLAEQYIRRFLGAEEFLNNKERWCLWFHGMSEMRLFTDLQKMPLVAKRIELVKQMRLESSDKQTNKAAATPHLFQAIRQPESGNYLLIPSASSETREFIPIGYLDSNTINGNANFSLPNATLYHFGLLSSTMHNAFMRTVAGRLKSDYRYSNTIVYNNFPFPFAAFRQPETEISPAEQKHRTAIATAAQAVLDARAHYIAQAQQENLPEPSLADLYRRGAPFTRLHAAHAALDKAVDNAYGYTGGNDDADRVEFLFGVYEKMKGA
ncbi:N-6 DNA methylase [Kingella kingae]|uniref:class I SAM-dependent DNA methyltransferase n=1 Tax=Kingella kingae TaxID=504 RepID=UPI00254BD16B|nr:DNA methyltransferase [Kingella kingae]MDK4675171.1 N-6 DNA methylase [Kingella kingae]